MFEKQLKSMLIVIGTRDKRARHVEHIPGFKVTYDAGGKPSFKQVPTTESHIRGKVYNRVLLHHEQGPKICLIDKMRIHNTRDMSLISEALQLSTAS